MTNIVQLFDRPCCGPSAAATLADFLRGRTDDDVTVEYHNLNDTSGEPVSVPTTVIAHLRASGALPVMTVDGQIVAVGTLPNLMDALDLAAGRTATSAPTLLPTDTPGSRCC
jgi:hypothetical protein